VPLTIRHFFIGEDVMLGRLWEWHDGLAATSEISYYLYIFSRYSGPLEDINIRPYTVHKRPLLRLLTTPVGAEEVWIIRGWNLPLILPALLARYRRVPTLMWQERPGLTYEATNLKKAVRIWLRQRLLPVLFLPYRRGTILLGTGEKAVEVFQELSHGSPARVFPYPSVIADACLNRNLRFRERNGSPLFLFAGRFEHRKALDLIINACEDMWSLGQRFRVRYVGSGPMKDALEEHVRRSGGRAELYPFADRLRLLKHYEEADVVLLPSRFDGWGLVVHEGLASGLPVIVSDACGAADLVAQSGCGKVIQPNNVEALKEAMSWVITLTPQQMKRIHAKAVKVARDTTVPKLNDRLVRYCREALEFRN
jgi:glycosyltransferase involved in cell wall biosynthesis